jgi:hypothetical protein
VREHDRAFRSIEHMARTLMVHTRTRPFRFGVRRAHGDHCRYCCVRMQRADKVGSDRGGGGLVVAAAGCARPHARCRLVGLMIACARVVSSGHWLATPARCQPAAGTHRDRTAALLTRPSSTDPSITCKPPHQACMLAHNDST